MYRITFVWKFCLNEIGYVMLFFPSWQPFAVELHDKTLALSSHKSLFKFLPPHLASLTVAIFDHAAVSGYKRVAASQSSPETSE